MIVAGFGFRAGATVAAMRAALDLARHGLPPVTHLATLHDKAEALAPLARALGLPVVAVDALGPAPAPAPALGPAPTPTTSSASLAARGVGSVAEASALCAAGDGAHLLRPRQISPDRMATCAIAQGTPA
jgi:cobalt-precorrin 5A hydrolase